MCEYSCQTMFACAFPNGNCIVSTSQSCLADETELTSDCQFSSGILKKEVS